MWHKINSVIASQVKTPLVQSFSLRVLILKHFLCEVWHFCSIQPPANGNHHIDHQSVHASISIIMYLTICMEI